MHERYGAEEKEHHLGQWKASGKSAASYAAAHGIAQSTFSKWVIKDRTSGDGGPAGASSDTAHREASSETIQQETEKHRFIEIRAQSVFAGHSSSITIRKSGFEIDVPISAGLGIFEAVLKAAAAV
jgi:transposase-like protein